MRKREELDILLRGLDRAHPRRMQRKEEANFANGQKRHSLRRKKEEEEEEHGALTSGLTFMVVEVILVSVKKVSFFPSSVS